MSESINCNFARAAVRHYMSKYIKSGCKLPRGKMPRIVQEYNQHFQDSNQFQIKYSIASKRFPAIYELFKKKWHPTTAKSDFLVAFNIDTWSKLSQEEKQKHTPKQCKACMDTFPELSKCFPAKSATRKKSRHKLVITESDLSSATKFGRKALQELNCITEKTYNKSIQEVLVATPKSALIHKPTRQDQKNAQQKCAKEISSKIQQDMDASASDLVLQNRMSWGTYDRMRKTQSLVQSSESVMRENEPEEHQPKRRHGYTADKLQIDKEGLLAECSTWSPTEQVNWSQLGQRYGITTANRGQVIKEYLASQGIEAAKIPQRTNRKPRRARKKLCTKISFPAYRPSSHIKAKLQHEIEDGGIPIGEEVVKTVHERLTLNSESQSVATSRYEVSARKIPLLEIRKKLLQQHEEMGIMRDNTDIYLNSLQRDQIKAQLDTIPVSYSTEEGTESLRSTLAQVRRQRFLKVWHDHATVAGHGHILVLVSVIYDPAFYYTSDEMKALKGVEIDVPTVVEKPQIHILGRSGSSTEHQLMFLETRRECLKKMEMEVSTSSGVPVCDYVRFFHGDGPAAQFEAGHKQGGNYSCVGCGAETARFDDIAYSYRCPKLDLAERQKFVLQGKAWRKKCINPMDNLKVQELRKELESRGVSTHGKKRPQLESEFEELRRGIANVAALLQSAPDSSLSSICLERYEVLPTEPLHDIKGHLSNIIDETLKALTGETLRRLKSVSSTVLGKETLRCSDYRKAALLFYITLAETEPSSLYTTLFQTAVEICELLYADDSKRTSQAVLRLHNVAYIHGKICTELFSNPKTVSKRKMFGRYFHSLMCHAPLLLRLVSLKSINTELQERMFGQCKAITKATSNYHPNHIITNLMVRLHKEEANICSLEKQEGEVHRFAQALPQKQNTVIPKAWLENGSSHYQAHLERIGDYLLPGPGGWWQYTDDGVEYFDVSHPTERYPPHTMHHFRESSLAAIDFYLHTKWEQCCEENVPLPAIAVRWYHSNGTLSHISTTDTSSPTMSTPTNLNLASIPSTINSPSTSTVNCQPKPASLNTPPTPTFATVTLSNQSAPASLNPPAPSHQPVPSTFNITFSTPTSFNPQLTSTPSHQPIPGSLNPPTPGCQPSPTSLNTPSSLTSNSTAFNPTATSTPSHQPSLASLKPPTSNHQPTAASCNIPSTSTSTTSNPRSILTPSRHSTLKSTLAEHLKSLLPKELHTTVKEFDELRQKVKEAKKSSQLASSTRLLQQYNKISNQLKLKLLEILRQSSHDTQQQSGPRSQLTSMKHKARLAKKILEHEWGVKTQ